MKAYMQMNAPRPWACLMLGFLALYGPVYAWAAGSIWTTDEHAHAPLVLAIVAGLLWSQRQALWALPLQARWWPGGVVLGLGLLMYVVGRWLSLSIFELVSQIPVLLGSVWILGGRAAVRLLAFPLFYLIFSVPMPGEWMDAVTGPLKRWISAVVETGLYAVGYPIARQGVTLSVGPYQLLVADACSGLNSMFSLVAVGLLYLYLAGKRAMAHRLLLLLAILPVAWLANVIRVMGLVLLTYHFGDEVGQSYLHGMTGLVLMLVALGVLLAWDTVLLKLFPSPVRA